MSSMTDFNDLHQTEGSEAVKACIEHAIDAPPSVADDVEGSVQLSNWAEPKEIKSDLPLAPAFDAKAMLPEALADFVLDEADRMPCSPDYIANDDDLHRLESMLVSQATSLQSIFSDLARKAQAQTYLKHFETYLGLALKAQAQSRATITALGELKNPRHATFVKQANIAHGPQQVNNGVMPSDVASLREKNQKTEQNKLLEDGDGKFGIGVVPGKAATPK